MIQKAYSEDRAILGNDNIGDSFNMEVLCSKNKKKSQKYFSVINDIKKRVNAGEMVDFKDVDTHVIAGLLKCFLRDLEEPLLTYDLYDEIIAFKGF